MATKVKLLYADDDPAHLWLFHKCFDRDYEVLTATSGPEALEIFDRENEIGIVLADQRMPEMTGVEFLGEIYARDPLPVRILVTGFSDMATTLEAINTGHIFSYVAKPWNEEELRATLSQACGVFRLNRRNAELTLELQRKNQQLRQELQRRRQVEEDLRRSRRQIQHLSRELLRAQEEERKRIALDLHDKVAQDLSSLKLMIETMSLDAKRDPATIGAWHPQIVGVLQTCIDAVRNLSSSLLPPALSQLGLAAPLEHHCRELAAKHRLRLDFHADAGIDTMRLPYDLTINLYRFVQEAFNNVCRHARASWVQVLLDIRRGRLVLAVVDDGQGFDLVQTRHRAVQEKRMGIQSMEERIGLLGGSLSISTAPGKGTAVRAEVPLPPAAPPAGRG